MPPWPEPGQNSLPRWLDQPPLQAAGFPGAARGRRIRVMRDRWEAVPAWAEPGPAFRPDAAAGTQLASPGRRIGAFFLTIPLAIVTLFIGYIIWGPLV